MTATATLSPAATAYLSAVNAPGVNVVDVEWTSDVAPAAAHRDAGVVLSKIVTATVMTGVEYARLAVNNDRETGDLPWGEWAIYPYVITHKGREYARLYTVDNTVRSTYLVNGKVVRREDFDQYLTAGARKRTRPHGGTITVKMDNLAVI